MLSPGAHNRGYILTALLGAIAGGLMVAVATKAFARMITKMIQNMMAQMREAGRDPLAIRERMMSRFGEAQE